MALTYKKKALQGGGLIIGGIMLLILGAFKVQRAFPDFSGTTVQGQHISTAGLRGKKTIVLMYRLGCPGAAVVFKDLQDIYSTLDTHRVAVLGIAENTPQQVRSFHGDGPGGDMWHQVGRYFDMKPLSFPVMAECDKPLADTVDAAGNKRMGSQCRRLGALLKVKVSPTIFFLNEKGDIYSRVDNYRNYEDPDRRKAQVLDKL